MKNFIAICISCLIFSTSAIAQMDQNIVPKTSKLSPDLFGSLTEMVLPRFTKKELAELDYNDSKNGQMPAIARNISTNIDLYHSGTWTILPNGDRVWRIQISAAGALALAPLFDRLYLPEGASMHVYMPKKQEILGAFTNDNTPEPRAFCCGLIHGPSCIIEYYEPLSQKNKGIVSINKVGYAYRDINPLAQSDMKSGSASCEINAVCSEGDRWRNQIRSVVRIFVVSDNGNDGWCSGAMVNNVRKDCTPYVLSAEHCTEGGVSTSSYNQWVFYFNYQAPTCSDSVGPQNQVVNGCKKIADSEDGGGSTGSDFLFLELNHVVPSAFNVYYSGWNVTGTVPPSGVCIHHPSADIKKISTYLTPAVSTAWGNFAQNTHWQVTWSTTVHGHGVTEPGSSGSPLFSTTDSLIVGHLTGGGSCCTFGGCGSSGIGPNAPDEFGKVAYDWTSDGVSSALQLKPWLDPDNTGTTVLHGINPPCGSSLQNDAGIQAIDEPVGNVCAFSVSPTIVLRNFGANNLTKVTITYRFDNGSSNTYAWTGNLFPGTTTVVTLPSATLSAGAHSFTAATSNPNNVTDANAANNSMTSTFFVTDPAGSLNLMLTTDNSGSKTTWQVTDASSNVVASGGPYPNIQGGTTYNIPFCLPIGCYTFTIFSSQSNGIENGVQGNFVLSGNSGTQTYATLNTPAFGSSEAHNFCIQPSAINEIPALSFSIIPNPSTGLFTIMAGNSEMKMIRVYDITGRAVFERKSAEQNVILDLSAESKGVYILQIETELGKAVQKLVLK